MNRSLRVLLSPREAVEKPVQRHFQEMEHTADWAVRVRGRDLAELFVFAAQAMVALVTGSVQTGPFPVVRQIELSAPDVETLLVDWLSELVYLHETGDVLFCVFEMEEVTTPPHLQATIRGRPGIPVKKEIKAVTYHGLEVQPIQGGYEATVVFDV